VVTSLSSRGLRGAIVASTIVAFAAKRVLGWGGRRSFVSFFVLLWTLTYKARVVERPTVSFHRSFWNNSLVEKMALKDFFPVTWAWNRHAQTITCFALSHLEKMWSDPIQYETQYIPAFDAPNQLAMDWASLEQAKHTISHAQGSSDQPVLVCIPGLGDDRNAPYVDRFVRSALRRGYRVVVHSYWRYDFEESRDLTEVLDAVGTRFPSSPIIAVAWSAGAYLLTRYLEKARSDTPLIAAVCQSGCLDFPQAVDDVLNNENPTYGIFLDLQGRICMRRHLDNDKNLTPAQKAAVEVALAEESRKLLALRPCWVAAAGRRASMVCANDKTRPSALVFALPNHHQAAQLQPGTAQRAPPLGTRGLDRQLGLD
jgi:predicted alpha/beta-fold hydrolase